MRQESSRESCFWRAFKPIAQAAGRITGKGDRLPESGKVLGDEWNRKLVHSFVGVVASVMMNGSAWLFIKIVAVPMPIMTVGMVGDTRFRISWQLSNSVRESLTYHRQRQARQCDQHDKSREQFFMVHGQYHQSECASPVVGSLLEPKDSIGQ